MAFALAAALARKHAPGEIKEIHLKGSGLEVDVPSIYLSTNIVTDEHNATVVLQNEHNGICYVEADGKVLLDIRDINPITEALKKNNVDKSILTIPNIVEFCNTVDLAELDHIRYAMKLTQDICQDGIDNPLGMQCGRVLLQNMEKGLVTKDEYNYTLAWTIAGLDARMGGTSYTAMSNTGSGNQAIICTMAPWLLVSGARSLRKRSSAPSPSPT